VKGRVATFSIVARDRETGDLGCAVQSKFLSVGSVVPWGRAGVGMIATQALANTAYGPRGLELLADGLSAPEVVGRLAADDEAAADRQVGIVDARGLAAAHTGGHCFQWAGHVSGEGYACQGNILVGPETVEAMARAFEATAGDLAGRLTAALAAGQAAGGDRRGRQSAALLVLREGGGYGGYNDRYVDLRVDDHERPIEELGRLLDLYRLYFYKTDPDALVPIEGEVLRDLQRILRAAGYLKEHPGETFDGATRAALKAFYLTENFEERYREDEFIDGEVLAYARRCWP